MVDLDEAFLAKAQQSFLGAESEFVNGRYDNCANRCYYACFQAAIYALVLEGIRPVGPQAEWGHAFVQSRFAGDLIGRRKRYRASLRDVLSRNLLLRHTADYKVNQVSETQASRALRRTFEFISAIEERR
jgi:uncharacterized protein (UPF0332 family)